MPPKAKTTTQQTPPGPQLLDLEVTALAAHPRNVRRSVGDVTELAASIEERGVLEPLVVAPAGDGTYVVIAGHRRLAAAQQACITEVPCIVRHDITEDVDVVTAMLVENLMRSDLSAVEEAEAYQQLEMAGVKPAQIAQRTGRSKATVTSRLALMRLPESTRDKVHGHQLNLEEAAALLDFADDPTAVARLEQVAGTPNWRWELQNAKQARDTATRTEQTLTALAAAGVKVVDVRDLKRGTWMHTLAQVLDDDDVPGITDDSDPSDDEEARRAAHAACPHHAAYLTAGSARYVCLDPSTHAAPSVDEDDDTTEDDEEARAARDAERAAAAEKIAQEEADVRTAAGIRHAFVTTVCTGQGHTLTPDTRDAIALTLARVAVEVYLEVAPLDVAPFLGVDLTDRPASSNYTDEQAWQTVLEGRVQAAMTRRDGAYALLAVLASAAEEGLRSRHQWAFDSASLTPGSNERRYLDVLRSAGYELTAWETSRLAAADEHAAQPAA